MCCTARWLTSAAAQEYRIGVPDETRSYPTRTIKELAHFINQSLPADQARLLRPLNKCAKNHFCRVTHTRGGPCKT